MTTSNPIEKAVLSNVKVDYAAGSLTVNDPFTQQPLRVGIADLSFLTRLMNLLSEKSGTKETAAFKFFYEFGQAWGAEFYARLSERITKAEIESIQKPQDYLKDEFIEHLNSYLSYAGIGQFRITEGNKFYVISLKNSIEFSLNKPDSDFMNAVLQGFFSALFSLISGKTLLCTAISGNRLPEKNRYAISTEDVIGEIEEQIRSGKTEKDILRAYGHQHLD